MPESREEDAGSARGHMPSRNRQNSAAGGDATHPVYSETRVRYQPGFPFWPSRSAPLYPKRPSAWAGCVRGPCFKLPTPSAGVTWRPHAPESTWFWGISRTPLPACARSSRVLRRDARCTSARRHGQRPDPLQHRPEQASGQVTLRQQEPVVPRMFHWCHTNCCAMKSRLSFQSLAPPVNRTGNLGGRIN